MKFNPFTPNSIAGPGMFAGRMNELELIDKALFQAKHGNPWHFLIHGERGIGKSSLLLYAQLVADGEIKGCDDTTHNFVTAQTSFGSADTYVDIVSKIGSCLTKSLKQREVVRSAAKGIWDFLTRWEAAGVKFNQTEQSSNPSVLCDELLDSLVTAVDRLGETIDGIVILIDEADKAPVDANFGEILKHLTESLTRRRCNRVCIGVSGISTVIDKLRTSHESSPRILNQLLLEPLRKEEVLQIIDRGIELATERSSQALSITAEAADWIARYSEGYPHFVQQYAFSAVEADRDWHIDVDDVNVGAFTENGALDQLGMRYFEDMYLDQINSDEYRKILQVMAEHDEKMISRSLIKDKTQLKDTTLTNALALMKDRRIIMSPRGKKGLYYLPSESFSAWIRGRARRDREQEARQQEFPFGALAGTTTTSIPTPYSVAGTPTIVPKPNKVDEPEGPQNKGTN